MLLRPPGSRRCQRSCPRSGRHPQPADPRPQRPGRAVARRRELLNGRQARDWEQAVGRSRGGRTSKIHGLADACGRPVALGLTPGNLADISLALPLLSTVTPPRRRVADKAYDVDSLRRWLKARRVKAVIPSTATRTVPYPLDRRAYRHRNLIERLFCRLKNWRRIATRYDRLARNDLAALALVAVISEWI
jgi:transposase